MLKVYNTIILLVFSLIIFSCKLVSSNKSKLITEDGIVKEINNATIREFSLKAANDTIEFVLTSDDFNKKKPVLIYLQGSTPVPIGVRYGSLNEDSLKMIVAYSFLQDSTVRMLNKNYHLVVISMPKTPLFPLIDNIHNEYVW